MGTRSFISKKLDDERYKYIYCHWDGYPEGVGAILKKHYTDPKKVDKLLNLGSISSLGKIIGHKHNFDRFNMPKSRSDVVSTTAYHRDRGEKWEDVKPKYANSKDDLIGLASGVDYVYFFENGKWSWVEIQY